MNANGQVIETLASSQLFQNYERAFNETTGMPVTLRPLETWRLPFHGKHKENAWCALMAENSRTCAVCLQTQERLAHGAMEGPSSVTCSYGLSEIAVPLRLGEHTVGFLQTGQVMRSPPTAEGFDRALAKAGELGTNLDPVRAREAFFQTPVLPAKKLDSAGGLLTIFADHLAMRSNQLALQTSMAEPPVVAKAKAFIREHHTQSISLGQVAAFVHVSVFYFCKLFRRTTGTTFTEFLSRIRVEKAKNLLLNPNLRISEIAFEVGFQSLTHFNRVFKNVVGESPTHYRKHLPAAA